MKKCLKCGNTEFVFTAEDQYVKVDKPFGFFTQLAIILCFLTIVLIPLGIYILKNPKGLYVEKRKTIATCKKCWQKHLIKDQLEQQRVEESKLL